MQIEDRSLEQADNATTPSWTAPLVMLVAWLARFFEQITKLKRIRRTTRFKPNCRDHWTGLRKCEWLRDQTLAAGSAQLLANKPLDLSNFVPTAEPPADYGGPCPRTPFEMNRRFLALARFNADPEAAIRAHTARISGRPLRLATRSTSPALRAEEETNTEHRSLSSSGATRRGRWLVASSRRDGGGSRSPRGPPQLPQSQQSPHLSAPPLRTPPRAQTPVHPRPHTLTRPV